MPLHLKTIGSGGLSSCNLAERPNPELRPPPKAVLKEKSWMHCTSCTLYLCKKPHEGVVGLGFWLGLGLWVLVGTEKVCWLVGA